MLGILLPWAGLLLLLLQASLAAHLAALRPLRVGGRSVLSWLSEGGTRACAVAMRWSHQRGCAHTPARCPPPREASSSTQVRVDRRRRR